MKRTILTLSLLSLCALSSCKKDFDEAQPRGGELRSEVAETSSSTRELLPTEGAELGVLYIRLQKGSEKSLRALTFEPKEIELKALSSPLATSLRSLGASGMEPLFPIDPRYEERMRQEGLDRWFIVRFNERHDLRAAMQTLLDNKEVDYAEPVYPIAYPNAKPVGISSLPETSMSQSRGSSFNDPRLKDQWHYNNTGSIRGSVPGADISLFKAWETEVGKSNVIVAVNDGGIDVEHPDLVDNLYVNLAEKNGVKDKDDDNNGFVDDINGFNFIKNNGTLYPDDASHGTHVAGTVAARNNNGIGVCGVAGGDGTAGTGVKLMSCQVFGVGKEGADAARAFVYSANNGAVISQNSWGYRYTANITVIPPSMKEAIDYFIKWAGCDKNGNQKVDAPMKGGIVIFAAGNDGRDYKSYPGAYEAVVAVSSMNPAFTNAPYSNRGDWIDIMAPGGDVNFGDAGQVISTLSKKITKGDEYGGMQGTSMACPHVSGVAALIVSHFGGQGFTSEKCKQILLGSLKSKSIDQTISRYAGRLGRGYIDASAAFATNKGKAPAKIASISIDKVSFITANLSFQAVADEDDGTPVEYRAYLSTSTITEANHADYLLRTINGMGYAPGHKLFLPLANLKENTTYSVAVEAVDRWGLSSGLTISSFTTKKNNPPLLKLSREDKIRVSAVSKQSFSVAYSDPDGQTVSIDISGEKRGVSHQVLDGKIEFTLRAVAPAGNYSIKVTATDELGAKTTLDIPFEVYTYKAPEFTASMGNQIVGASQQIKLDVASILTYTEGINLTYSASAVDGAVATASISKTGELVITGYKPGTTQVQVEVSDGISSSVQTTIPVRVVTSTADAVYSVYPIPATTVLNLVMDPSLDLVQVEIVSTLGTRVFDKTYTVKGIGSIKVPVKTIAPGAYVLRVKSAKGTYTKGFVKQ